MKIITLSESDKSEILELVREKRSRRGSTVNRPGVPEELGFAPETYVARISDGSVPGFTEVTTEIPGTSNALTDEDGNELTDESGDLLLLDGVQGTVDETEYYPGSARCDIWRVTPNLQPGTAGDLPKLVLVGIQRVVYNLSTCPIPSEEFFLVTRDKFGYWFNTTQDRMVYVDLFLGGQVTGSPTSGQYPVAQLVQVDKIGYLANYTIDQQHVVNVEIRAEAGNYPVIPGRYLARLESTYGPIVCHLIGRFTAGENSLLGALNPVVGQFFFGDHVTIDDASNKPEKIVLRPLAHGSNSYVAFLHRDYTDPTITLSSRMTVSISPKEPFWGLITGVWSKYETTIYGDGSGTSTANPHELRRKFNAYSFKALNFYDQDPYYANGMVQTQFQFRGPNNDTGAVAYGPYLAFEIHGYSDYPTGRAQSWVLLNPVNLMLQPSLTLRQDLPALADGEHLVLYQTSASGGAYLFDGDFAPFLTLTVGSILTFVDGTGRHTVQLFDVDSEGRNDSLHRLSITLQGPMKAVSADATVDPFLTTLYWFDGYASSLPFWGKVGYNPVTLAWGFIEATRSITGSWTFGGRCSDFSDGYIGTEIVPANGVGVADDSIVLISLCPMSPGSFLYGAGSPGPVGPVYVFFDGTPGPTGPPGANPAGPVHSVQMRGPDGFGGALTFEGFSDYKRDPLGVGGSNPLVITPSLQVTNQLWFTSYVSASGPVGTIVAKMAVYGIGGTLLGYLPIYDTIT